MWEFPGWPGSVRLLVCLQWLPTAGRCQEPQRGSLFSTAVASDSQAALCALVADSLLGLLPEPAWGWASRPCPSPGVEHATCWLPVWQPRGAALRTQACCFAAHPARNVPSAARAGCLHPVQYILVPCTTLSWGLTISRAMHSKGFPMIGITIRGATGGFLAEAFSKKLKHKILRTIA